jgi:hypothetical protein
MLVVECGAVRWLEMHCVLALDVGGAVQFHLVLYVCVFE